MTTTAGELHRRHVDLDPRPLFRLIDVMGLDGDSLSDADGNDPMEEATTTLEELDDCGAPEAAPTQEEMAVSRREARRAVKQLGSLEDELDETLSQLRSLTETVEGLSRRVRRTRGALLEELGEEAIAPRKGQGRRSGRGRPDTIVEACRKILEGAQEPMKVAEITERVLEMGLDIRAKNPNVTVSSILSSYEIFTRVRRGYYELVY